MLLSIQFPAFTNHIVGGEIEFITIQPGQYVINLIQYFDDLNQINPGPPQVELSATVSIFNNSKIGDEWDPEVVATATLNWVNRVEVPYTNVECSLDGLQTSRVLWSDTLELDPREFDNPDGYYIAWERCCRNEGVINLINPRGTGMKYVTEIPPLWKDGAPYTNSSPILFSPLSDYGCINQLYYTEFTGFDPDGDSLVYSIAGPLNSSALEALPTTKPKPHIPVKFNSELGFDAENQILGNPKLAISSKGLLTVSPSQTGLFVFSILVEEYRNDAKIGSVQRDFQMLVVDGCNPPDPPVVGVKIPGNDTFEPEIDTLKYELTDDKCFEYIVTNITPGETISLRAEGVNFEGDLEGAFKINQQFIGDGLDTLIVEFCAPGCPPFYDKPFIVDLIAGDDACPLPQLDTSRLIIEVEPPPNEFPNVFPADFTAFVNESEVFSRRITGTDVDGDIMTLSQYLFSLTDIGTYGFDIDIVRSEEGILEADLTWNADCEAFDFGGIQNFPLIVEIDDLDSCNFPNPDLLEIDLNLVLPFNSDPVVSIDDFTENEITITGNDSLNFNVSVVDADGDTVNLELVGKGINPAALGVSFEPATGVGSASSEFKWLVDCNFLIPEEDNSFIFQFVGDDVDRCEIPNIDTLTLKVNVEIPENVPPQIDPQPDFRLEVNESFTTEISAFDENRSDLITLKFMDGFRLPRSESLAFPPVTGSERVTSTLSWQPECDLLGGRTSRIFELMFVVFDDACPVAEFDTTTVLFEVVETRDRFNDFLPPNVFTPNGDGMNETFNLTNSEDPAGNLPPDNCDDSFEYISIHNRAGETIFYSENREFNWDGSDRPSGVYFYVVKFSRTEYKNYIQLMR